jgi:protein-tyrosine phosphatase
MYTSILFICSGNICRSPTAEGMLRQKLNDEGLTHVKVDSAGIHAFHEGSAPDFRAMAESERRGYPLDGLISRPVNENDFEEFDLMIAMDDGHFRDLTRMKPQRSTTEIKMHSDFAHNPEWTSVPDPYYGGEEHFRKAFDLIENGVDGLIEVLKK